MLVKLRAVEATPDSFAPFGQSIAASPDGDQFSPHDAHLDLIHGIPRLGHGHLSRFCRNQYQPIIVSCS
jgi:hypothetical protein